MTTQIAGRRHLAVLVSLLALLILPSLAEAAVSNTEISDAIDEFFFRVEQLEFAQYLARTAVLNAQPEDHVAHSREIISILTGASSSESDVALASPIGLIDWAEHAADDPALLSAIRPSIQTNYLYSYLLVVEYLELALSECEQTLAPGQTLNGGELHLKRAYAFLSTALGTSDAAFSADGLKAAEAILPREVSFLSPGDSIQAAVDGLASGGAIFLNAGEYGDQQVILAESIWISRSPAATMQVRIVGRAGFPAFLARGDNVEIELSDLTIAEGYSAIRSEETASCWISDCTLIDNTFAGVEVTANSVMTLTDSRLRGNDLYGVFVTDTARVALANCDVSLNASPTAQSIGAGIAATDHATLNAQDCSMIGNLGYGIILSGSAILSATNLDIIYSQHSGIHLQQASHAYIATCHIASNGYWDISTYNNDCYAEHASSWNPEKAFTGRLEGIDNSTQAYDGHIRTCLGDYVLPDDFFYHPQDN